MTQTTELLSASLEDYLEAIFHIEGQKRAARAKDIAERLKVSSASVTGALRLLAEKGLINYAPYDLITLTANGQSIAEDVVHRHEMLRNFFIRILAVDEGDAEVAACKMEHGVSPVSLERMTQFIEFLQTCPRGGHTWNKATASFCEHGMELKRCPACLRQSIVEIENKI
jgi:DtxR family transcriptional regulator, Mn-dependent transcriptional regulator